MIDLLQGLADWQVAVGLRNSRFAYPLVNAAHILAIGLLVGTITTLDLKILGAFRFTALHEIAPPLTAVGATGLLLAALSGFFLFSVRPLSYSDNPAFLMKVTLVAAGVVNALLLRRSRMWRVALRGGEIHPLLRLSAALSICIWCLAILSGRWIGFLE